MSSSSSRFYLPRMIHYSTNQFALRYDMSHGLRNRAFKVIAFFFWIRYLDLSLTSEKKDNYVYANSRGRDDFHIQPSFGQIKGRLINLIKINHGRFADDLDLNLL